MKKIQRPNRDPDMWSKRGVPYFFAPDWIRGTSGETIYEKYADYTGASIDLITLNDGRFATGCKGYNKIHPVKENGTVNLYMKAKDGNLSYIQGSIQKEFKKWHEDRSIDYMLLGMDPDEILASDD